jgi:O-antigen/teichoic acid export membrane protein
MAEHEARKDTLRLNQFINTALVLYLIISAVFCAAFLSLMPAMVNDLLRIPGQYAPQAIVVFRIGIVLFFVNMIAGIFGSLITGFQQIAFSSLIGTASAVLTAAGTFFVLERGYGLMGLLYNNAVITAVVVLLNVFAAYRLFPHMQIRLFTYFTRDAARTMFGYAWKVQVSNISQLMIFQIDRVLLSRYVDLAAVSNYEVANRVASQVRALIASIFSPMLPAASALHASADGTWIPGLYARSFKYLAVVAIPCSLLVVACAQPFMRSWMGPGFSVSAVTLQVLMVAYMLNLLTGPGAFILGGINRPHIGMRSSVFASCAASSSGSTMFIRCRVISSSRVSGSSSFSSY